MRGYDSLVGAYDGVILKGIHPKKTTEEQARRVRTHSLYLRAASMIANTEALTEGSATLEVPARQTDYPLVKTDPELVDMMFF